ncbi:MAG: T9SS type A sorting domain-containing protein [Candidatus Krumholzibacteriota bacterium]|nr:T9SS type A sorting domain-containing protein [Candidatus Krumholzibacteriota bacterium]
MDIALPNPPPTVTLSGFVIRNLTNIARAFIYGIETSGPATFPGGLTFISGSTPILQVNEAFEPPATVLEIPDVPGPVLQQIDYDIFAADDFTITESCVTTIDYIVPVPTLFQEVRADIRDGRVLVAWSLYSDDPLTRLTIARARGTGSFVTVADLVPSTTTFVDRDVAPGLSYSYVVIAHLADGHMVQSQRVDVSIPRPTLVLFPGTPNPFNPTTTIRFTLDRDAMVSLRVFDVSGRSVRTLIRSRRPAGANSVVWDGTGDNGEPVASGVYIFRLDSGKATRTVKGTLIK